MTEFTTVTRRHTASALVLATLLVATGASAQSWSSDGGWWGSGERIDGSGKRATEARAMSGFSSLQVSGSWTVQMRQGNSEGVTVEADDNLLQYIETKVDGKTLHIQPKKGTRLQFKSRPVVTVNFIDVRSISLGGANNLDAPSYKVDKLEINLGGGGNVKLEEVDVRNLNVNIGGSGTLNAKGKATSQSYNVGGSGTIRAEDLVGDKVSVSIGGSGSMRVHANDTLNISVAGSGSVAYKGDPKITRSIVGSGSVRKIDN